MNIAITFRHLEASDAIKAHATEKIAKLQKFLRAPMRARVTVSLEDKSHGVEVEVNAGAGHFVASEWGDDMYACVDKVLAKLERQITGAHSSNVTRRKGADNAAAFAVAQNESLPPSRPPAAIYAGGNGASEASEAMLAASGDERS
jgi:putative sigma-54 modulation protein